MGVDSGDVDASADFVFKVDAGKPPALKSPSFSRHVSRLAVDNKSGSS
jgi:hypothetical protein